MVWTQALVEEQWTMGVSARTPVIGCLRNQTLQLLVAAVPLEICVYLQLGSGEGRGG